MKLSAWVVLLIGFCLSLIVLAFAFVREYRPKMQEAANFEAFAEQLEIEGRKLPQAEQRLNDVIALRDSKAAEWQGIVARRTPADSLAEGGIDLSVNRWQLVGDAIRYRESLQRAVNRQVKAGGITVVNGPLVPAFSTDEASIIDVDFNYAAVGFPVVILNLGQVTVRGTIEQIFRNVESWSNMPNYLAVADGLALSGTSPEITGTYNVSVVAFIRGDEVAPPVPAGAAAAGGGGFGGPGGFPGGPPPGFGGPGGPPPGFGGPSGTALGGEDEER